MRLVEIVVPEAQRRAVKEVIQDYQLGYSVAAGGGDQTDSVIFHFALPADAVEHVLTDLEEVGFDKGSYSVSMDAEFAHFEHVDTVQNRWGSTPNRLAPDALRSKPRTSVGTPGPTSG